MELELSLFDPQSWNAYSYVKNRPLSHVDPDGDIPVPVITGAVGAVAGAIFGGGSEAVQQYIQHGEIRNWAKIGTAALGGGVAGGLAGGTLGFGAAAGAGVAATTAEVVTVEAASNVIGGVVQRRADEALGYESPVSNGTELANIAVDATIGAAFGYGGGRIADNLFPIPNVRREIELLRFAHRRSTRATRIATAQRAAERQVWFNSSVAGVAGGVPDKFSTRVWQWYVERTTTQAQEKRKEEVVYSRVCFEDGTCTY